MGTSLPIGCRSRGRTIASPTRPPRSPCSIPRTRSSTYRTRSARTTGRGGCRNAASISRTTGIPPTVRCSRCTTPATRPCPAVCSWPPSAAVRTSTPASRSSASCPPESPAPIACSPTCWVPPDGRGRSLARRAGAAAPGPAWSRGRAGPRAAVLLVATTCLLVACSPDRRTPLVIYSPHGRDLLTTIEQRFEALHPDVVVHWLDMGSQEVYDRLRSERANPAADVWFGGPATIFARGAADSLLEPFRPSWASAIDPHGRGPGDRYFAAYETPAVVVHAPHAPRVALRPSH